MSKKVCRSSPSFFASTKASQVATIVAPSSMLLQILAAWPAPRRAGVDHRLAHVLEERLGARRTPASVPPTMKVSVPASAAAMPPETGASTIS